MNTIILYNSNHHFPSYFKLDINRKAYTIGHRTVNDATEDETYCFNLSESETTLWKYIIVLGTNTTLIDYLKNNYPELLL